jgi:predicted dithiol-disulfide oxidoreductase (DUF899 family)
MTTSSQASSLHEFFTRFPCHFLDLVPKGRDEDGLKFPMKWVRRRDQYR